MLLLVGVVALVALQRLVELVVSRRHEARLRARGAWEPEGDVFPHLVVLHALFLPALVAEFLLAPWAGFWTPGWGFLAVFGAAQLLRYWAIGSLGTRWTTRVLVVPDADLVQGGPYRFLDHPNYVAVVLELAVIPLAFRAFGVALVFTVVNLLLLGRRIRVETEALERAEVRGG